MFVRDEIGPRPRSPNKVKIPTFADKVIHLSNKVPNKVKIPTFADKVIHLSNKVNELSNKVNSNKVNSIKVDSNKVILNKVFFFNIDIKPLIGSLRLHVDK